MELIFGDAAVSRPPRDRTANAPSNGARRSESAGSLAGLLARAWAAIHRLVAGPGTLDLPEAIGATDRDLARLNRSGWSIQDERERMARSVNLRRPM